jgi:diaminohydroxyphosphoribosylaminopyrimidine deaminase/5-amino-6-(5-phosphoribosylamino)uracil reductase
MSLRAALKELAGRGISSVLLEGGGRTLGEAFRGSLVDEVRFFLAPVIQGGEVPVVGGVEIPPVELENVVHKAIGSDILISGTPRK